MQRASLDGECFEVVVIGGGINGVAIARECVRAGRRTLLLEQNDFGSGTTSRSTRIIHGGLRYLQYAEIGLVRESLRDRNRLLRDSPHLVRPIRFVLALNGVKRHSALQIRTGLWLYRQLGRRSPAKCSHQEELRSFEQQLDAGHDWSIFEYEDAQCEFPERLVAEWLGHAAKAGGVLRNYCRVIDILQSNGKAVGVVFRDRVTNEESTVQCKWVVNATGPWIDHLCAESSVSTGGALVGGVRGSHIVVPRFPGAPSSAVYTQATDGRPMFVIPWNDQVLVGTTEVPDRTDPSSVLPSAVEIEYLLRCVNLVFPSAKVSLADVHFAYSGIRPLPYVKDAEPSAITRKAILWDHKNDGLSGMISVIGGKLTTAASLARRCARMMGLRPEPLAPIAVAPGSASGIESALWHWAKSIARQSGICDSTAHQIASWHGPRAMCVVRIAMHQPEARRPLCPHTNHIVAEAVNALRFEFAVTLGDVLLRRVPVALGRCWSEECSRVAAASIGAAMGWSTEEIGVQVENLEQERSRFLFKPKLDSTLKNQLQGTDRAA